LRKFLLSGAAAVASSENVAGPIRPPRGVVHPDPDPYLFSADVNARYRWSPRTGYRNRKLLPPPDIVVNGREGRRKSTLDRHDAEQRGISMAHVRKSIEELREFVIAHSDLTQTERTTLNRLIGAATRLSPSDLAT
jgi:hypothetical protein